MRDARDPIDNAVHPKTRFTAEEVAKMRLTGNHRCQECDASRSAHRSHTGFKPPRQPVCAHFRRCHSKPEHPTSNIGARAMEEQSVHKAAQNGKKMIFLRNFSVSEEDVLVCNRVRRGLDPAWLRKQNAHDRCLMRSRSGFETTFRRTEHESQPSPRKQQWNPSNNARLDVSGITVAEDFPLRTSLNARDGSSKRACPPTRLPMPLNPAEPAAYESGSLSPRLTLREKAMHGRYLIRESFANGSYGKVCAGEDVPSHEEVAVKIVPKYVLISPEEKQSVLREKVIHRALDHPGIIKLIDVFEDDSAHFFILERAVNGTLSASMGRNGMSEDRCRHIFGQILEALKYLHQNHIVHHDIKPHNVLLHHDDAIKLCDFGASRALDKIHSTLPFTGVYGTPGYIAPELLLGEEEYGSAVDIFSAGVLLFEMLLGFAPFYPPSSCTYQSVEFPTKGCDLSDDVKNLLLKMLCKDPQDRITASKALQHKWFQQDNKRPNTQRMGTTSMHSETEPSSESPRSVSECTAV